ESLGQSPYSNSRHIMWKLSEENTVQTFDPTVTHDLLPVPSEHASLPTDIKATDCKDSSMKRARATENWQLLLQKLAEKKASIPKEEHCSQKVNEKIFENKSASDTALPELKDSKSKRRAATHWRRFCSEINQRQHCARERKVSSEEEEPSLALRCKPSNELPKYKRSKDPGSDICTNSTSTKVVSDLKLESFSLPPQQSCVVREEPPKFAQGLLKNKDSDWGLHQDTNPLQDQSVQSGLFTVDISPPTSSSFAETTRRNASQIKRRSNTGKVSTSTDESSATAAKGKKSASISSGSSAPHFPNFRQRQQELHRYRVLIEQRRLDLLELRIAREREEARQYMILFQKKMQIKECKIRAHEAYDCSNV
ncbi:hypothetical protein KR054_006391, partial [Drosophila jambulina]